MRNIFFILIYPRLAAPKPGEGGMLDVIPLDSHGLQTGIEFAVIREIRV
jgi:hypothetical protein